MTAVASPRVKRIYARLRAEYDDIQASAEKFLIDFYREYKGLSSGERDELAREFGVGRTYLDKWAAAGKAWPNKKKLIESSAADSAGIQSITAMIAVSQTSDSDLKALTKQSLFDGNQVGQPRIEAEKKKLAKRKLKERAPKSGTTLTLSKLDQHIRRATANLEQAAGALTAIAAIMEEQGITQLSGPQVVELRRAGRNIVAAFAGLEPGNAEQAAKIIRGVAA